MDEKGTAFVIRSDRPMLEPHIPSLALKEKAGQKSGSIRGKYQKCMPVTQKNVGKQMPHEKRGKKDYSNKSGR